ncbi:MAG: type III secretion system translocon subunit SctB [Candidatus Accumulibacter sp.]|jgi:hypothetical protein|nr:type III secretion system translocon subunit SctB [Accumulibacter sp.]
MVVSEAIWNKRIERRKIMSITSISDLPNFNQQTYENLLQHARAQGVSASQVDNLLLEADKTGQSFDQAAEQVGKSLPRLAPPNGADTARIAEFGMLPSPGALVMSLVTKFASEQREQNREVRHAMTEELVESMHDEADKMREMAAIQLAMGIVSGALTIAGGAIQTGFAASALKTTDTAQSQAINTKGQGISQAGGGFAGIAKAVGDYYGTMYQAEIKEMQADQEKMREMRDSLKDLDESLKELIQKSLSAQDSIQQAQNQARAKILG